MPPHCAILLSAGHRRVECGGGCMEPARNSGLLFACPVPVTMALPRHYLSSRSTVPARINVLSVHQRRRRCSRRQAPRQSRYPAGLHPQPAPGSDTPPKHREIADRAAGAVSRLSCSALPSARPLFAFLCHDRHHRLPLLIRRPGQRPLDRPPVDRVVRPVDIYERTDQNSATQQIIDRRQHRRPLPVRPMAVLQHPQPAPRNTLAGQLARPAPDPDRAESR